MRFLLVMLTSAVFVVLPLSLSAGTVSWDCSDSWLHAYARVACTAPNKPRCEQIGTRDLLAACAKAHDTRLYLECTGGGPYAMADIFQMGGGGVQGWWTSVSLVASAEGSGEATAWVDRTISITVSETGVYDFVLSASVSGGAVPAVFHAAIARSGSVVADTSIAPGSAGAFVHLKAYLIVNTRYTLSMGIDASCPADGLMRTVDWLP
jgi:hypothetical protein